MSLYASLVWLVSFTITISTITALPSGHLGCFADLTPKSDRKTDVVIYSNKTVHAYTQTKLDHKEQVFDQYKSFQAQGNIQSISAMDFSKNGVADLFIVTENDGHYQLEVRQDPFAVQLDDLIIPLADKNVLILDANGDFIPDIFGKTNTSDGLEVEGFWFGNETTKGTKFTEFVPLGIDVNNIMMETVSFIDLDQDCRADLVYITKDSEIRMISGRNFQHNQVEQSDESIRLFQLLDDQLRLYFADVNKDGAMDIIIPSKKENENKFQMLIQDKSQSFAFKDLCSHTKKVKFEPDHGVALYIKDTDDYALKDGLPIIIQDINMDSKINIVSVLENAEGHHKVFVSTIPENAADLDPGLIKEMPRDTNIEAAFDGYSKIKDVAFFHSGEFPLGLHFLIQKATDYSWHWVHLERLLNDKGHGFLSICPLNDNPPSGEKKYGGTMSGVTVKAFFRSRSGNKIFLSAGSLYQTNTNKNYLLPFIVFGLGDPDSYIEKLVIGYSLYDDDKNYVYSQPGVPPNSQLVLFAYGNPWRLETFLAPYITPEDLAVIIAVVMAILGGIWLYLEIQERKSANRDQLKSGSTTANNFFF